MRDVEGVPSECCRYCPHLRPVTGACDHDLRQALRQHFADNPDATCPVYGEEKTVAMRSLAAQLDDDSR